MIMKCEAAESSAQFRRSSSERSWSRSRVRRSIISRSMCSCTGLSSAARLGMAWQTELEDGALARCAFGAYLAPMALDDPLDDREADAGALELALRMQSLEDPEELGGVLHVEPRTVVLHQVGRPILYRLASNIDASRVTAGGELVGVGQQIDE